TLSAIKLQLGLLIGEVKDPSHKEMLVICDELLSDGIEKMKFVANSIMPSLIESFGIETAIKSFVNRVTKNSKIQFQITSNLNGYRFPPEQELHLYRIMTELITNTLKHSGASEVNLDLRLNENLFTLTYFDDGIGYVFKTNEFHPTGIGLRNIQNRVLLIGGEFRFFEKDGKTVFVLNKKV
ncbi:MAG: sensor histidine kinase, partial [Syntrophothermus sp.]